ncbi:MAG: endonuclease [Bacteroidota bacterium]
MKKLLFLTAVLSVFQSIAGTITTSVGNLYNFKECYVNHSATAQWFTVSGSGLSANVVITAPDHYEVSTDLNKFYSQTLALTASGTLASTKIFVRFSPSSTGSKTGNVDIASVGSATKTIAVSGTGTNFATLSSYYPATANTGAALKTSLYSAVNAGVKSFSYGALYTHYPSTETYYDGTVWDVYSTKVDAASPFTFNHGQKQCGNYSKEGDCYNREHTMPQSWFNESSPMVSDIHHILPTDGKVNGMRSNFAFGEVSSPSYTSQQGAKLGANTTSGYNGTVFEPIDEYKGDIARGLLYMAVRYEDKIASWSGNGNAGTALAGNAFPAYDQWFIDVLLKWHNQDPPSSREIIRNNYIATSGCQNNRNPFIDSPQYAQKIWGGNMPLEPAVIATDLAVSNNTGTSFLLKFKSGDGFRRLIVVRPATTQAVHPADNNQYPANSNISAGSTTGLQNHVVYNGTSSSVTVNGLTAGTNYVVNVYEYNGWYNTANYRTSTFASITTAPLAVEWGTLTATKQTDKGITLDWSTLKETNNSVFEVERSINYGAFASFKTKTPAGNSTTVQNYSVGDDTLKNASGNAITNLSYRIKQVSINSDFSYSNTAAVVVVKDTVIWGELTATRQPDKSIALNWSTAKEVDNNLFEIERSLNNGIFQVIGTKVPAGNSTTTQNYTLADDTLKNASSSNITTLTYRIRQTGLSGKSSYSNQVLVKNEVLDTVIWGNISATKQTDKSITLDWNTLKEINNTSFEIERSINSGSFVKIRTKTPIGNSTTTQGYSIVDDTLKNSSSNNITTLTYRIKQVCASNRSSYSNAALVTNNIVFTDTVIWGGFTATLQNDNKTVRFDWSTLLEHNNSTFQVQFWFNAGGAVLGAKTIPSKGNSTSTQTYTLTDTLTSGLGDIYFRVKQTGTNGNFSYSNEQLVHVPAAVRKDSVSISGFDASMDSAKNIKISWTANYEGKAGTFDLLRSIDSRPYYIIKTISGGPHDLPNSWNVNDDTLQKNPGITKLVYRLRYTGENQSYVVNSDTQMVVVVKTGLKESSDQFNGSVYPMPFHDALNISVPLEKDAEFHVSLSNLLGQEVYAKTIVSRNALLQLNNLEQVQEGIYLLSLKSGDKKWHLRVIKQ